MRLKACSTVVPAFGLLLSATNAHALPTLIGFDATIASVGDAAGVFAGRPTPTGHLDGVFTVDTDAGVVSFGDGTTGQRLPDGSATVNGTYRYGAGGENAPPTIILFHDCFVGTIVGFACVPGRGSDAYVIDLPPLPDDGLVQSFAIALVGGAGLADPSLLPPPLDRVDTAQFVWRFTTDNEVALVAGRVDAIGVVPEPSSMALGFIGALALVARARWVKRTSRLAP